MILVTITKEKDYYRLNRWVKHKGVALIHSHAGALETDPTNGQVERFRVVPPEETKVNK